MASYAQVMVFMANDASYLIYECDLQITRYDCEKALLLFKMDPICHANLKPTLF